MEYAEYKLTNDDFIPAIVTLGEKSTPVWRQNRWETGEYRDYVRNNGCGHCCAAMALNLYGVKTDPHGEYSLCRKLWGAPDKQREHPQGNYQSVSGITKILKHYGVKAEYFGVPDLESVEKHIDKSLKEGKQVIFWSHSTPAFTENPFSKNEHYVMAVGYTRDNKILVANSSEAWTKEGVQLVEMNSILRALFFGAEPIDTTWGQDGFEMCAGYVVVG